MIGLTGTNRWSEQGLETGYILNVRYWGRGYAGEAFRGFLGLYWGLEGEFFRLSFLVFREGDRRERGADFE